MSLAAARHRVWSDTAAWWQVAFEMLNDGFLGDVGLDDITQTAGPCGAELSCSFEAEGCGLVASRKGTWEQQSNGTGTTAGPVADHTTGTAAGMGPWQPSCFPAALSVLPACTPHHPCLLSLCHACPALHALPRMSRRQYCTGLPNPATPQMQSLPAPGLPNPGEVLKLGRLLDLGGKHSPLSPSAPQQGWAGVTAQGLLSSRPLHGGEHGQGLPACRAHSCSHLPALPALRVCSVPGLLVPAERWDPR